MFRVDECFEVGIDRLTSMREFSQAGILVAITLGPPQVGNAAANRVRTTCRASVGNFGIECGDLVGVQTDRNLSSHTT